MAGSLDPRDPDWPADAADRVVSLVDSVRDKTTVPLQTVARGIVYGFVAAMMLAVAAVLVAVAAVRAVDVIIPGQVWRAHAAVGTIFVLVGLLLWRKSRQPKKDPDQ